MKIRWYWPSSVFCFLLVLLGVAIADGAWIGIALGLAAIYFDTKYDVLRTRK